MMMMMNSFIMITFIVTIMMTLMNLCSTKKLNNREKSSPFECGFDPKSSSRIPFSLHFFLIAMIFLIFDIEISLMFPICVSLKSSNIFNYFVMTTNILIILMLGLIHEWNQGSLKWKS